MSLVFMLGYVVLLLFALVFLLLFIALIYCAFTEKSVRCVFDAVLALVMSLIVCLSIWEFVDICPNCRHIMAKNTYYYCCSNCGAEVISDEPDVHCENNHAMYNSDNYCRICGSKQKD